MEKHLPGSFCKTGLDESEGDAMKNKLGVYYGFLDAFDVVDWDVCLTRTQNAGLDILEMSAGKVAALDKKKRDELSARARDMGLQLTFATGLPPEGDVSSDDASVRARGVKLLTEQIRLVQSMGGTAIGGILTGVGKNFPAGVENFREHAVDNAILALREVAKAAEDCGVTVAIEAVNRFESPLVNTAAEARRVADAVDSPYLGVLLDSFHMNIEEADLAAAIRATGKRLKHFHACENNRALPGQAHIDWAAVLSALRAAEYTGPLVMEALAGPYGTVAPRLNIWRKLCENEDAELKQAADFLRETGTACGL